ncbi:MAG: HepT-like ribonuclease domain-containing protein [Tepidisphaeraceae bacterium]
MRDIIEAAEEIGGFISGLERQAFVGNAIVRSAVLQKLTEIGEAAGRLSKALRSRHPEIEWRDIAAFRNIAVHAYFAVNWDIVWTAAVQDAPALKDQILRVLQDEFPKT